MRGEFSLVGTRVGTRQLGTCQQFPCAHLVAYVPFFLNTGGGYGMMCTLGTYPGVAAEKFSSRGHKVGTVGRLEEWAQWAQWAQ